MFLHIYSVKHCGNYCLECGFTNGETVCVDLEHELHGEVFEPLLDKEFFAKVRINHDTQTVEWSNGADFAPEFIYALGQNQFHHSKTLSSP